MKKNTKILIGILILVLIGGGVFYGISEMGAGKARKTKKIDLGQKVVKEVDLRQKLEKETSIDRKVSDKKSRLPKEVGKKVELPLNEATKEKYNQWLKKKESCQQKQLKCFKKAHNELWPKGTVINPNAINTCVQEADSSCYEFEVCKKINKKGLQPFSFNKETKKGITVAHPNLQEFEIEAHCKDKDKDKEMVVFCTKPDVKNYSSYNKADYKGKIEFPKNSPWYISVCIDSSWKVWNLSDFLTPVTDPDGTKKILYDYKGTTETKPSFTFDCLQVPSSDRKLCYDYVAAPGAMWFEGVESYTNDTNHYTLGYHIE